MGDNLGSRVVIRSGTVGVAVVQAAQVLFDTAKSLQKLADLAADAARTRAELIVFPETFVGGYPKGHHFGVVAAHEKEPASYLWGSSRRSGVEAPDECLKPHRIWE